MKKWHVVQVPRNRTLEPQFVEHFHFWPFAWNYRRQCDKFRTELGLEMIHHEIRRIP